MADGIFDLVEEIKSTWHCVTVPQKRGIDEITTWLDENCTGRYYFNTMTPGPHELSCDASQDIVYMFGQAILPVLYLKSMDDMVFYNLTWEKYD